MRTWILLFTGFLILAAAVGGWVLSVVREEPIEPEPLSVPPALAGLVSEYEKRVLPMGTLVRIEGEFKTYSQEGPGSGGEPFVHHSGRYVSVFPIGDPDRIHYRCANFSVPTAGGREHSTHQIEVVCDGTRWLELEYGTRYRGGPYRSERRAVIRPMNRPSWYVFDATTGMRFFPLNASLGGRTVLENSGIQPEDLHRADSGTRISKRTGSDTVSVQLGPGLVMEECEWSTRGTGAAPIGWRSVFSGVQAFDVEGGEIHLPVKETVVARYGNGSETLSSETMLHSVRVLKDNAPSEVFEGRIPSGWSVRDEQTGKEYREGDPLVLQWWKNVFD